jgi:HK97 gp10 family phage protein
MVGKVTFEIRGAKEMEDLLKELGPNIASRIGDRALKAGAKPIIREAKRLCPKQSGELRKSIAGQVVKRPRQNDERVVLIGFKPPASRRAHFIEFGTSHNAAKPFMRPALDSQHGQALTAMAETLADGIARAEFKQATSAGVDFGVFTDEG